MARTRGRPGVPPYCCLPPACSGTGEARDVPSQGRWRRAKCLVRTTASRACRTDEAGGLIARISLWIVVPVSHFAASGGGRETLWRCRSLHGGAPFDAALVEDEFHMLWLHQLNCRGTRIGIRVLLSAALKIGWRIASASPEEQALLEAHGFGSGRVQ